MFLIFNFKEKILATVFLQLQGRVEQLPVGAEP